MLRNEAERLVFAELVLRGKNPHWSTTLEDRHSHFDIVTVSGTKLEIKGQKRLCRKDKTFANDFYWVEWQNVHGAAGWIRGEADWVMFQDAPCKFTACLRASLLATIVHLPWERNSTLLKEVVELRQGDPNAIRLLCRRTAVPYAIQTRLAYGKTDLICPVPIGVVQRLPHTQVFTISEQAAIIAA